MRFLLRPTSDFGMGDQEERVGTGCAVAQTCNTNVNGRRGTAHGSSVSIVAAGGAKVQTPIRKNLKNRTAGPAWEIFERQQVGPCGGCRRVGQVAAHLGRPRNNFSEHVQLSRDRPARID